MSDNNSAVELVPDLTGSYDNFLQIWKQQTEDEIHRDKRGYRHDHIHIKFDKLEIEPNCYEVSFYKGRNNQRFVDRRTIYFSSSPVKHPDKSKIILTLSGQIWVDKDKMISVEDDGEHILFNGFGIFPSQNEEFYKLARCRFFSGFIEYPIPHDPERIYRLGNLETHDQGGMVELDYEGIDFTIELTQLIFAHKIKLMKIAIYDLPMKKVGINSKAISYAWSSPESKRLGINIRRLISGWTFIEDGFLSSNNMNVDQE